MAIKNDLIIPSPRRPVPPPPPPPYIDKRVINITVDGTGKDGGLPDSYVLSALQSMNDKLMRFEYVLSTYTSLELGEVSGTAYPGDKGFNNALAITLINEALTSLVSRDDLNDALIGYATTEAMSYNMDALRNEMADLEEKIDNIDLSGVSSQVESIVTSIMSTYQDDYSELLSSINDFNDSF